MSLNHYIKDQLIGRGRFCQVYKVEDPEKKTPLALKVSVLDDEVAPHSAQLELQLLKNLGHSEKYTALNWIMADEKRNNAEGDVELLVLMPFYSLDLVKLLATHRKANFPSPETAGWRNSLPYTRALGIIHGVAQGLAFLHEHGIIHRDIKPENIMFLEPEGEPYIIDLDVAWRQGSNKSEPDYPMIHDVGTTVYRAPELLFGLRYDASLDMWPLGLIICQMFASDSSKRLFEPYYSDIRLISAHIDILGAPTTESWPQAAEESETFRSMGFKESSSAGAKDFQQLAPNAPRDLLDLLPRLVCYEASQRLTARELYDAVTKLS